MSGSVTPYTDLITSGHSSAPNFMATVAALTQPSADQQLVLEAMVTAFDLDTAYGAQLDALGLWVGQSRNLAIPLVGVYFALDTTDVGFDQGTWQGPYDPAIGQTALADDSYRMLLRAKIAANHWDGTLPGAYTIWNTLFSAQGCQIVIQDNGNMTMTLGLVGAINAVTLALFTGGYLSLRPCGVSVDYFITPTAVNAPFFGFDVESSGISGFDVGAWGTLNSGQ